MLQKAILNKSCICLSDLLPHKISGPNIKWCYCHSYPRNSHSCHDRKFISMMKWGSFQLLTIDVVLIQGNVLQFVWKVEMWAIKCMWIDMFIIPVWVRKWTVSWDESLDLYGHIWHLEIKIPKTIQTIYIFLKSYTVEILKNCIGTQNVRWWSMYRLTHLIS